MALGEPACTDVIFKSTVSHTSCLMPSCIPFRLLQLVLRVLSAPVKTAPLFPGLCDASISRGFLPSLLYIPHPPLSPPLIHSCWGLQCSVAWSPRWDQNLGVFRLFRAHKTSPTLLWKGWQACIKCWPHSDYGTSCPFLLQFSTLFTPNEMGLKAHGSLQVSQVFLFLTDKDSLGSQSLLVFLDEVLLCISLPSGARAGVLRKEPIVISMIAS